MFYSKRINKNKIIQEEIFYKIPIKNLKSKNYFDFFNLDVL